MSITPIDLAPPIAERLTLTKPAPRAGSPMTLADKLRFLYTELDYRDVVNAFEVLVDHQIEHGLQARQQNKRRGRRLIDRLRAAHACPKADAPGFVQRPATGPHGPSFTCEACGMIVELPRGGDATTK